MASICNSVVASLGSFTNAHGSHSPQQRKSFALKLSVGQSSCVDVRGCNFTVSGRCGAALRNRQIVAMATNDKQIVEEKLGIKIERNPPESRLSQLGVRSWPKWGCSPSKFPWTYSGTETCYLLKGKVKVYVDGDFVEFGAGDLVVFPDGMSCTWEVFETVDKHYSFS